MYLSRNKTVSDIANTLTKQNYLVKNGPSDTFTRQGEINEWQAQNKLDTLFFLQTLFIYLTAFVVLLFLRRYDLLPSPAFYLLSGILTVAVVGILWNRAYYTAFSRDKRYWNRRFIGLDTAIRLPTHHEINIQYNDPGNAVDYTPLGAKEVKEGGVASSYYNYIFNSPQYINPDGSGNVVLSPGQTVASIKDASGNIAYWDSSANAYYDSAIGQYIDASGKVVPDMTIFSVMDPNSGNTASAISRIQGSPQNTAGGMGQFTGVFQ
jgi:hypothetical protein